MPFIFKRLVLALSMAAAYSANTALAADKDASSFKPGSAASYSHQTNAQITIGVEPYATDDKVKTAFGKLNPYQYGILPVLVVIQNDGDKTIKLDRLKVEYVDPGGAGPGQGRVDATPAREIRYLRPPQRPGVVTGPGGITKVLKTKKNPLDEWEIEGRAFAATMLPPGQSASGFFYFQTTLRHGSTLYLSGLTEAGTGKEIIYFEVPLQ